MSNTNSTRDYNRLRQQKQRLRPLKKKWEYYWDYYKIPAIIILLSACMLGSIFHTLLTQKEVVLSVAYINAFPNINDAQFMEGFNRYLGINSKKQDTLLDSTYYINEDSDSPYTATYQQKFSAMAMAGKLDVVVADEAQFSFYANQGFFQDLSTLLSAEEMSRFEQNFLYCDLPDDEKDEAVAVGINVTAFPKIVETASYPKTTAYYGVVFDSQYTDNALAFLTYLESAYATPDN
ncbi:MAG: hypothetical protein ACI4D2_09015 [Lachnospiraceae bacterium]